ncbi:Sialate O-acetylesterase [Flagellimonas maritima]|uniref:Sialate O-acetylesterase n=1 Tax=Flagellimonas maritima TaxID=1383885 RepID=A0A2Z4LNR9_9FLAO|nr:GDSL-type esterase/lipase family protein [Allomuricauda aurantiaca]AWX43400.1 Sialate O-acetylesterase [Allomuricauda aurantiaca]
MRYFFFFFLFITTFQAQEIVPFAKEVNEIKAKIDSIWDNKKETIVFTGSSSIRMWRNLQDQFPEDQIINTGFGGSQTSDLKLFLNELILDYNPSQVFIYEGDNDIFAKKRPNVIIETMQGIIHILKERNPKIKIVLISAKPSISRWHLRGRYKRLNKRLNKLALNTPRVFYADVWTTMLHRRKLKKDLFIEDGLHMNAKGYDLWYEVIKNYMNTTNP